MCAVVAIEMQNMGKVNNFIIQKMVYLQEENSCFSCIPVIKYILYWCMLKVSALEVSGDRLRLTYHRVFHPGGCIYFCNFFKEE